MLIFRLLLSLALLSFYFFLIIYNTAHSVDTLVPINGFPVRATRPKLTNKYTCLLNSRVHSLRRARHMVSHFSLYTDNMTALSTCFSTSKNLGSGGCEAGSLIFLSKKTDHVLPHQIIKGWGVNNLRLRLFPHPRTCSFRHCRRSRNHWRSKNASPHEHESIPF